MDGVAEGSERPSVRPEDMRCSDADRERVLDRLREAHVEGRLDVGEFDDRITATLAARTYRELAVPTEDLPDPGPDPGPDHPARVPAELAAGVDDGDFRSGVAAWAAASVTTTAIWAVSCIASESLIHPWFFWVAGPWGAVLLVTWLGMRLQQGR